MIFHRELADNIRETRQRRNMTQKELAQRIGITQTTLSNYERAKRIPGIKIISMMCDALDVSLDELVPKIRHEEPVDRNQTNIYDLIG